jgi:hypothetical protein
VHIQPVTSEKELAIPTGEACVIYRRAIQSLPCEHYSRANTVVPEMRLVEQGTVFSTTSTAAARNWRDAESRVAYPTAENDA